MFLECNSLLEASYQNYLLIEGYVSLVCDILTVTNKILEVSTFRLLCLICDIHVLSPVRYQNYSLLYDEMNVKLQFGKEDYTQSQSELIFFIISLL